jgi:hypothetical protein
MTSPHKVHPHDVGLPEVTVRKRRRSRRLAMIMLAIAAVTAAAGAVLFRASVFNAVHIQEQPPSLAIVAYAILIVSSVTLVLGLWYLLLAQVERLARMVDAGEIDVPAAPDTACPQCRGKVEGTDRFCRHCGAALIPNP